MDVRISGKDEHLRRRRIVRGARNRPHVFTPEVVERIHALRPVMTSREVAADIGVSINSLHSWARDHAVKFRQDDRATVFTAERRARIMELAGKVSAKEIAEAVGVTVDALAGWAVRNRVSLRHPLSQTANAVAIRLHAQANQLGYRISIRGGRVGLWISVEENLSMAEAKAFLSHANRAERMKRTEAAYGLAIGGGPWARTKMGGSEMTANKEIPK
jgi:hypothetical protein